MGKHFPGDKSMVKKKYLKKSVINQVSRFSNQLAEAGFRIKNLIIFGSQVRGTAKRWSDIDVCVVSTNFGKDRHTEGVKLLSLTDNYDWRIEPHPYHPKDLADKWDPLAHEIRKYGVNWQEVAPQI